VAAIDAIVTAETGGLDLVTPDYELRFRLLNEVHTVGTVIEVTCGVTTGANNRIVFEPDAGAGHNGNWGVGAIIETTTLDSTLPTIDLHTDFMSFLGCQIRVDHSAGNFRSAYGVYADGCEIINCLADGVGTSDYGGFAIVIDGPGATVGTKVENCASRGFYCGIGLYIPSVLAVDQIGTVKNCTFNSEVLNVIVTPASGRTVEYEFTNCVALGNVGSNIGAGSTLFTGSNNFGVANSFPVGLTELTPTSQTASPPGDWIIYQVETLQLFDVPENDAWDAGVGTSGGAPAFDIEGIARAANSSTPGAWEEAAEALVDIYIDYSDGATPQYIINVPQEYGILVQVVPSQIRQVNIDQFRQDLNDLMDDPEGMPYPTNHFHTPPVTISGVTLARVVEILDPYVIQFEDNLYNVNIVGGNSNISDKTIKNQVGVNTANSAGLQDPFALQAGAFLGEVTIDANSTYSGTVFPTGTRGFPVNNLADAKAIADARGLAQLHIVGDFTVSTVDISGNYILVGDSYHSGKVSILESADVRNIEIRNLTVEGNLDGTSLLRQCSVENVEDFCGTMIECGLVGPITLQGHPMGSAKSEFVNCYSQVAGGGPGLVPYIDLGGDEECDLVVRGHNGGLGIRNNSRQTFTSSLDFSSGRLLVDSDITHGEITVRGSCEIEDSSAGSTTLIDKTLEALTAGYVWDEILTGATHNIPNSAGRRLRQANALVAAEGLAGAGNTTTLFNTDLASAVDEFYDDHTFVFTSGDLAGQARVITGYDGTTKQVTFDEPWTSAPAEDDEFIVFADHELTRDQIVEAILAKLLSDGATFEDTILRVRRHMTNKMITDPVTGVASLYSDDGLTVDETSQMYEDAAGSQTYQGEGAERREGFEDAP
jgi:hypothetical protein